MNINRITSSIPGRILSPCLRLAVAVTLSLSTQAYAQSDNALNAALQQAKTYEAAADYSNAVLAYKEYLQQPAAKSAERRQARLKYPVLQEAVKYGAGPELPLYLEAMNLRAAGDSQAADAKLEELIQSYQGSSLSDDALYLRAYIALMDHYDYDRSLELLAELRYLHSDSRYIDTALFAEAIIFEQQGDSDAAIEKMVELRDRHTGISVAGFNWARDEYLSRLWFERSNKRVEYLQDRAAAATRLISMTPYGLDGYQWQAELIVDNQNMTLLLNENRKINNISTIGSQGKGSTTDVNAYSGIVMGQPDSWARITVDSPSVRGMVSVYGVRHELVPVASGGSLSDFHTLLLGDADGVVSDAPDHGLLPPKSDDKLDNYLRGIRAVSEIELTPGNVSHAALVGVVIDSKFNAYHGGRGKNEALSIMNTADGIFREQTGIALHVESLILIEDSNVDPMNLGSVTMEKMMRNFREFRMESSDLGGDIGLATLFSGNKNNDSALGLAWIGSACRQDGYDVSVVTPYRMPSLLSAHEIGHTLGAPHDTDTACSSQNRHMMWPFLSTNSGRTFSSCSKESIVQTLRSNNCHVEALDLSIELNTVSENAISLNVTNQDSLRAIPEALVTLSGPGVGDASSSSSCQTMGSNKLECALGTLTPMQSESVQIDFNAPLAENAQIVASVHGRGFIDVMNHNNSFKTNIYGELTPYAGPINNDPITVDTSDVTTVLKKPSSSGGGMFQPAGLLVIAMLIAARRRIFAS